jgi:hypothetical protein
LSNKDLYALKYMALLLSPGLKSILTGRLGTSTPLTLKAHSRKSLCLKFHGLVEYVPVFVWVSTKQIIIWFGSLPLNTPCQ